MAFVPTVHVPEPGTCMVMTDEPTEAAADSLTVYCYISNSAHDYDWVHHCVPRWASNIISGHGPGKTVSDSRTVYCFIFLTVNMIMIRFIIVSHGESSNIIPGHALVMDQEKQFAPLSKACGTACFAMSNWKLPMYVVPVPLSRYTGI